MLIGPDGTPLGSTQELSPEIAVIEGPKNHFTLHINGQAVSSALPLRRFILLNVDFIRNLSNLITDIYSKKGVWC